MQSDKLLDMQMTGIDFKRALRSSRWSHIPVFLMSSEVTDRMKHDAEAVGVKEVLAKPIQRRHLSALQRNLQAQRHLAVHHPISRFADANREIVNGSHGGKVVKPTMKRAVSLESHHIKPSKKARVMEQLMQIAETQPEKEEGSDNNQALLLQNLVSAIKNAGLLKVSRACPDISNKNLDPYFPLRLVTYIMKEHMPSGRCLFWRADSDC